MTAMRTAMAALPILAWAGLCGSGTADVTVPEAEVRSAVAAFARQLKADFPGEMQVAVRRCGGLTVPGAGAVRLAVRAAEGRRTDGSIPVVVEVAHPFGPQGAKGFAEGPSIATAPAIANAIYDAIGVRLTSLPMRKEKVLAAIKSRQ